jgi:hypothetical protein
MENLYLNLIKSAKDENSLIAIYTDKDNINSFSAGYVEGLLNEGLLLKSVDPNGFFDGLIFLCINDIYQLEIGSKYLNNLKIINADYSYTVDFSLKKEREKNLIYSFLVFCKIEMKFVSLLLYFGKEIIGYIKEVSNINILINSVSNEGEEDGLVCLKIDEISRVYIDTNDLKRVNILFSHDSKLDFTDNKQ